MPKIHIEIDVEEGLISIKPIAVIFTTERKNAAGEEGFNLGGTVIGDFPVASMPDLNRAADIVRRIFFRMFAGPRAAKAASRN